MEFEEPELTKRSLGNVLSQNETLRAVLNTLRIRGPLDVEQALSQIAMASHEKKSAAVLRGARAVLDLLVAAGLVEISDDLVSLPARGRASAIEPDEPEDVAEPEQAPPAEPWVYYTTPGSRTIVTSPSATPSNLSLLPSQSNLTSGEGALRITVQVALTGDDLADPSRAQAILDVLRSMSELARNDE